MATTPVYGIKKPDSDLVPANLFQLLDDVADSVEAALNRPYVELTSTAVTSIPHNTATKVNLATTVHNDSAYFSVSASVITVLQAGVYDIWGSCGYATSGQVAELDFYVGLNGTTALPGTSTGVLNVLYFVGQTSRRRVTLAAGDTLRLACYQFQGTGSAAVNTVGAGDSRLVVTKVA